MNWLEYTNKLCCSDFFMICLTIILPLLLLIIKHKKFLMIRLKDPEEFSKTFTDNYGFNLNGQGPI